MAAEISRYPDPPFWRRSIDHGIVNTLAPVFDSDQYDDWVCTGQQPA